MDWAEKYRPQHLRDIVGNSSAVRQMADWARNWTRDSPPLILYGKPGIGKTSSVYALATDMGWEVLELNASDQRTKAIIERIAGAGSTTMSLTGASRKLIIFDEADNLHGNADRGGAKAIIEIIKNTRQPVILIANDLYGLAKEIKKLCEPVQFRALQARSVAARLREICSAEMVRCDRDVAAGIAETAGGDMRAAVNMLYAAAIGTDEIDSEGVATSNKDDRSTIYGLVGTVMKGREDDNTLLTISRELSDTPDTVIQWLEAAAGQIPDPVSQNQAWQSLARADEFIGYTYRRQYYTLWKYASAISLIGTAGAAGGCGVHERIMPPERWRRMSQGKKQKAIRRSLLTKLSASVHIPEDTLRGEFLTPISLLVEKDPEFFVKELNLDRDELDFFLHDKKLSGDIIRDITKREKEAAKTAKKASKSSKKSAPEVTVQKEEPPAVSEPEPVKEEDHNQTTLFDGF